MIQARVFLGGWQVWHSSLRWETKSCNTKGKKKTISINSRSVPADSTAQGPPTNAFAAFASLRFSGIFVATKLAGVNHSEKIENRLNQAGYLYKLYVYLILKKLYVCVCIYI